MKTTIKANANGQLLDPLIDKERIELTIVDHLQERLPEIDRAAILEVVEEAYERLLEKARIRTHIPTLVEHEAMDALRTVPLQ